MHIYTFNSFYAYIIPSLCYPNKLTDCVFFIEVLFYAFTYMFWGEIMKKSTRFE